LPGIEEVADITLEFWENRMEQINNFENILLKTELLF
jgi:polyphosphate kinase 2 (PPK2 family)